MAENRCLVCNDIIRTGKDIFKKDCDGQYSLKEQLQTVLQVNLSKRSAHSARLCLACFKQIAVLERYQCNIGLFSDTFQDAVDARKMASPDSGEPERKRKCFTCNSDLASTNRNDDIDRTNIKSRLERVLSVNLSGAMANKPGCLEMCPMCMDTMDTLEIELKAMTVFSSQYRTTRGLYQDDDIDEDLVGMMGDEEEEVEEPVDDDDLSESGDFLALMEEAENTKMSIDIEAFESTKENMVKLDANTYKCLLCNETKKCLRIMCHHILQHKGVKPYTCKSCGKRFSQQSYCKQHVRTCSQNTRNVGRPRKQYVLTKSDDQTQYKCVFCDKISSTLRGINTHLRKHRALPSTRTGASSTPDSSVLSIDSVGDSVSPNVVPIFTGTAMWQDLAVMDMNPGGTPSQLNIDTNLIGRNPQNGKYICKACHYESAELQQCVDHSRSHMQAWQSSVRVLMDRREIPTAPRSFSCTYCPDTFQDPMQLIKHIDEHNDKAQGELPTTSVAELATIAAMGIVSENTSIIGAMQQNDKVLDSTPILIRDSDERSSENNSPSYSLDEITHLAAQFDEDLDPKAVPKEVRDALIQFDKTTRVHKCIVCGYKNSQRHRVVTHGRMHTGEKPFKCKYCPQRYSDKGALRRHHRHHQEDKNYLGGKENDDDQTTPKNLIKCNYCTFGHMLEREVQRHELVHSDQPSREFPFPCQYCPKGYYSRRSQREHIQKYHSEYNNIKQVTERVDENKSDGASEIVDKNKKSDGADLIQYDSQLNVYRCGMCPFTHNIMQEIKQHISTHLYKCYSCSASFFERDDYDEHKRLNHPEQSVPESKTFQCDICLHSFKYQSTLTRHRALHFEAPSSNASGEDQPPVVTSNNTCIYQCGLCEVAFTASADLQNHYNVVHSTHPQVHDLLTFLLRLQTNPPVPHQQNPITTTGAGGNGTIVRSSPKTPFGCTIELFSSGEFQCILCPNVFNHDLNVLLQHQVNDHNDSELTMYKNIARSGRICLINKNEKDFSCQVCPYNSETLVHLYTHLENFHLLTGIENTMRKNSASEWYIMRRDFSKLIFECMFCPIKDKSPIVIIKHVILQHDDKFNPPIHRLPEKTVEKVSEIIQAQPYVCVICADSFVEPGDLQVHNVEHFPGHVYPFTGSLRAQARSQGATNFYACTMCGATYVTKANSDRHIENHASNSWCSNDVLNRPGIASQSFTCPLCFAIFLGYPQLIDHLELHRSAGPTSKHKNQKAKSHAKESDQSPLETAQNIKIEPSSGENFVAMGRNNQIDIISVTNTATSSQSQRSPRSTSFSLSEESNSSMVHDNQPRSRETQSVISVNKLLANRKRVHEADDDTTSKRQYLENSSAVMNHTVNIKVEKLDDISISLTDLNTGVENPTPYLEINPLSIQQENCDVSSLRVVTGDIEGHMPMLDSDETTLSCDGDHRLVTSPNSLMVNDMNSGSSTNQVPNEAAITIEEELDVVQSISISQVVSGSSAVAMIEQGETASSLNEPKETVMPAAAADDDDDDEILSFEQKEKLPTLAANKSSPDGNLLHTDTIDLETSDSMDSVPGDLNGVQTIPPDKALRDENQTRKTVNIPDDVVILISEEDSMDNSNEALVCEKVNNIPISDSGTVELINDGINGAAQSETENATDVVDETGEVDGNESSTKNEVGGINSSQDEDHIEIPSEVSAVMTELDILAKAIASNSDTATDKSAEQSHGNTQTEPHDANCQLGSTQDELFLPTLTDSDLSQSLSAANCSQLETFTRISDKPPPTVTIADITPGGILCSLCAELLVNKETFLKHLQTHVGFKCPSCTSVFNDTLALYNHFDEFH